MLPSFPDGLQTPRTLSPGCTHHSQGQFSSLDPSILGESWDHLSSLTPWGLRRAESQASGQNTSASLCSSPALWLTYGELSWEIFKQMQEWLAWAFYPRIPPPHHHVLFIIPDLASKIPVSGRLPNSQEQWQPQPSCPGHVTACFLVSSPLYLF